MFNEAKSDYEGALGDAGYSEQLAYDNDNHSKSRSTRKQRRRIVWYNPPYRKSVATNIGQEFFKLLQLHFPMQHPLHSIFNRNTVKLSYSCSTNIDNILKARNAKILLEDERDKAKCLTINVVYKAIVEYEDKTQHYIGMTENSFKTRYTLHKSSLRHSKHRNQTELSNLIWTLTDKGTS